jgi:hypothetical protein
VLPVDVAPRDRQPLLGVALGRERDLARRAVAGADAEPRPLLRIGGGPDADDGNPEPLPFGHG